MRKPDEIALYAAMRSRRVGHPWNPGAVDGIYALQEEAARLGIPEKRAYSLLAKWSDRDWWNYGVSLRGGWFTPEAPEALTP